MAFSFRTAWLITGLLLVAAGQASPPAQAYALFTGVDPNGDRFVNLGCPAGCPNATAAEAAGQLAAGPAADPALKEVIGGVRERLRFLLETGLGYLTLDRDYATLSGGEAQRVRLATQLGMGLMGVIYVLDEPSIGLHPHDNQKLLDTLTALRDRGNTVVVVEHDEDTMRLADELLELGPGWGV